MLIVRIVLRLDIDMVPFILSLFSKVQLSYKYLFCQEGFFLTRFLLKRRLVIH